MPDKIYLYVPFEEKAQVKNLGARWDGERKCWYIERGQDPVPFRRWMDGDREADGGEQDYSIVSERAYVASAQTHCWRCRARIEVICVYCETGLVDGEAYVDFTVSNITAVDDSLRQQLERWPSFRFGYSRSERKRYVANHCARCGVLQGDYYLHCEPAGAFFTLKHARAGRIGLEALTGRVCLNGDQGFEP
ncbi:MAG TPA: DUF5710 domain-containing protein [Steroidobacteraceae bacterium]|nr:DUF5710 domain-containing protein [Steroidobacteraceae bacterium]